MGILDDAIREHLELKRQHGADESEVEGLEAEAFGPADRPDATDPPSPEASNPEDAEALTQVISPGSSLTAPAGEGDQLDKVFERSNQEEGSPRSEPSGEPSFEEHRIPTDSDAPPEPKEADRQDPVPTQAETPADPVAEAPSPVADLAEGESAEEPEAAEEEGDAGDALEMERQHLAGQPTEHYDVDAAIAEENEIDLLSESSLSDELDRALEGPDDPEHEFEPETAAAPEPDEPDPAPASGSEPENEVQDEPGVVTGEIVEETESGEAEAETEAEVEGEFFDQEDPLEGTPDFLEETPEHDRLWFEQKEPKDFDFGD